MITEAQIQAIVARIVTGYAPDKIILFGSYAHGTPTENSDLDLLIIEQNAKGRRPERSIVVRQLLWGTDAPAMDISIRMPVEIKRAAGIAYSVETIALEKGHMLYANTNS